MGKHRRNIDELMRSLFLKIFLWFWLAMILVVGAIALIGVLDREPDRWREHFVALNEHLITLNGREAARVWIEGGAVKLSAFLRRMEDEIGFAGALLDEHGSSLSPESPTPLMMELADQARRTGGYIGPSHRDRPPIGALAIAIKDRRFVFAAESRRGHPMPFDDPRTIVGRLVAVVLTAGGVCYALARYLTAPIRRLQLATRGLASGNLATRVGEATGRRGDEIGQLSRDFDFMAERLEHLVELQKRLLRDISHELRSPLSRLNVALELSKRDASPQALASLERIGRESDRLSEMIGQLLTLARIDGQSASAERVAVDLGGLLYEIVADAEFEAVARNRHVHISQSTPVIIHGVPGLLRSAIENIVRNAVAFTKENSIVDVSLIREIVDGVATVRIRVRDHGPGVPDAAVEHIFRPFYRVGDARDRESGGTGLGLAIAQTAIQSHGGRITATNEPGGGLSIHSDLPADEPQ